MLEEIIIAGSGGQGVMLAGKVLSQAAMRSGLYVSWLPAYGAEVRGGKAYCMVAISTEEIGAPYIRHPDTLIAMNHLGLKRFSAAVKPGGLVIANSTITGIVKKAAAEVLNCPCTQIAIGLGNIKVANIVAIGCYLSAKKVVAPGILRRVIEDMAPKGAKELIEANKKALQKGIDFKQ